MIKITSKRKGLTIFIAIMMVLPFSVIVIQESQKSRGYSNEFSPIDGLSSLPHWWKKGSPDMDIEISKEVYNGSEWVDGITVNIRDNVLFRIKVTNNGSIQSDNSIVTVCIRDVLPPELTYKTANPEPYSVHEDTILWLVNLSVGETKYFYITTIASAATEITKNWAYVDWIQYPSHKEDFVNITIFQQPTNSDTIIAPHIKISKKVYNGSEWTDKIITDTGENLLFRINVTNVDNLDNNKICVCIRDVLPPELNYAGANPQPSMVENGTIWWCKKLSAGESITLYVNATTVSPANLIKNWAYVDWIQYPGHKGDFVNITILPKPSDNDIQVDKEVWNGSNWADYVEVSNNKIIHFRVKVYNLNPFYNLWFCGEIYDVFPDNLMYIPRSVGNVSINGEPVSPDMVEAMKDSEEINGNVVTWQRIPEPIPPLGVLNFTFDARADGCGLGVNNLTAVGYFNLLVNVPVEDSDDATIFIPCEGKMDVKKEVYNGSEWVDNVSVNVGDELWFKINVTNSGNINLTNVTVVDVLPNFLTYTDHANIAPCSFGEHKIMWNLGTLLAQESKIIIFSANAKCSGEGDNLANASSDEEVHANDIAHIIVISPTCLNITKKANVAEAYIGYLVNYTIWVNNTGENPLYDVWANDTTLGISRYIDMLPVGQSSKFYVEHRITDTDQDPFVNSIVVEGHDRCGVRYMDSDTAIVDILYPDLAVEKYVKSDCTSSFKKNVTAYVGDQVTFKIYVNNTGEIPLDINIKDVLPDDLVYIHNSTNHSDVFEKSGNILYWNFTNVANDSSLEITFRATVTGCGELVNYVYSTGRYNCDSEIVAYDDAIAIVWIPCNPGIEVDKKIWNGNECKWVDNLYGDMTGKQVTFNITVKNIGDLNLQNVIVEDTLGPCCIGEPSNYSIEPSYIKLPYIYWNFTSLDRNEIIYVEFNATVECPYAVNRVDVTADSMEGAVYDNDSVEISNPLLAYSPHFYNFGKMQQGQTDFTTLQIWNSGSGTLNYKTSEDCDWVTVTPESGISFGEYDTITISVNTSGLDEGLYVCNIHIVSNGGSGNFTISVNVTSSSQLLPLLSFSPTSYDFCSIEQNQTVSTTFEIWNSGMGVLDYTLSENCGWINISPTSGTSNGEHDTITVIVNTTGLSKGLHTCNINIDSNGGNGTFEVSVYVTEPWSKYPNVTITKPLDAIYFRDVDIAPFLLPVIVGKITIEANATDSDGTIERVEFIVDNVSRYNDTIEPYSWLWNEKIFGFHTITVVAYDNDGRSTEVSRNVLIFNFHIS